MTDLVPTKHYITMSDTRDSLPEMLDPTDVCSAMDDLAFMEYCYSHFDVNHDHKVGLHEARAVREIDLSDSKVVSLRGIEYFTNLERLILDRSTVRELHLLQNTKLKEISAKGCAHLNLTKLPNGLSVIPNNEIWYTSTDGKIIEPRNTDAFGANIVSNTYENGKGIIFFDGDVTSIGDYAFSGCSSLTSITIPDSVTSIGYDAFHNCTSLTSIDISDSVTSIGNHAFENCTSLTSVTIGNGITSIEMSAFSGCKSLTSITIPDSVTSIGKDAFYKCSSLTSIDISDSVTEIGGSAFDGCTSLTDIYVHITNLTSYITSKRVSYPPCTTQHLVVDGLEITELIIPDGITSIGKWAFDGCSSLTSITIPDSVTSIGDFVFNDCTSLKSFYGKYASNDGRCLIVDGTLNSFAPAGLTEYTIPDSVTEIGWGAFYGCSSLTSVTIPDSVTSIGRSAFSGCKSLTSITIPDSVTEIGGAAFYGCTSLTSITIPDSVTWIEDYAFRGCTSLKEVFCKPITPPTLVRLLGALTFEFFYRCSSNCKIYVPRQSVEAYKSAQGWKEYANAIVGYDFEAEKKSVAVEQIDKSPYYLFFDTETTGLPRNYKAPASDTRNWPRMVQLAWIVANKQGDILKKKSYIIRPEGYTISSSATAVHGITTEKALREGESMKKVLAEFGEDLTAAKVLVAHNMAFDKKIVHAEYIRMGCENMWTNGPTKRLCTMMSSVNYCALPGFYDEYKWPKLQELHEKLFGYEFDDAHDALADIEATFKCYWELRKLGLIE